MSVERRERMAKYRLGDRVCYTHIMQRLDTDTGKAWTRLPVSGEGIIVGKRTCTDGYTKSVYAEDGGYIVWWPTKHHSFWLVAYNLRGCRYVAEGDIVAVEVSKGAGIDGHCWEKTREGEEK